MYKHALLTERIMHNCVSQLLLDDQSPRTEDVECLCKLLNTVGGKLDAPTTKAEFKERLSAYFDRMKRLTENTTLESRIRFMVQDVLDLKERRWQPRQKVEGPKKISEVHQDAARQQQQQEQRDRDEFKRGGGGGGGGGYGGRGGRDMGRGGVFDNRVMPRDEVPTKTINVQRPPAGGEVSLRPDGMRPGATGGQFGRPGAGGRGPHVAAPAPAPPQPRPSASQAPVASASQPPAVEPPAVEPLLSEDKLKQKAVGMVGEHFNGCSALDSLQNLQEIVTNGGHAAAIPALVAAALDFRGPPVEARLPPFVDLFLSALSPPEGFPPILTAIQLAEGSAAMARNLHHIVDDMPKAPELIGSLMFAPLIAKGVFKLDLVLSAVLQVAPAEEGADAPLVESINAQGLVYSLVSG